MKLMDPTEIPINNMRNAAKGTVVLKGRSKEDLDAIQQYAAEKLGTTYEAKFSEKRKPKILIREMSEKLTGEDIITKMKRQNKVIQDADLRVLSIFGKDKSNGVIEIDSEGFNKVW